mmetsp:Transcript_28365/g.41217  ORF Transcript_28365/g.41217 Transcript_28365/m.41217 type:complete len:112 (+) Transcript_28365:132-467(+)
MPYRFTKSSRFNLKWDTPVSHGQLVATEGICSRNAASTALGCCAIRRVFYLVYLSPVAASVSEAGSATSRLAEHNIARTTEDDCLCVAEYSSDLKATWALDIHEETVRTLY